MNRVPPDYHISPVGTHAGDRISKKTVPGAFEVPGKTLRKLVTTRLDPRSETTLPRVAAPPRSLTGRRIGADDSENAGKKELAARRTTRPLVGLRRRLAPARSLSDPRPPTPRTDTWAIPVPHNCGGAAAAASRTSPRLKLRQ